MLIPRYVLSFIIVNLALLVLQPCSYCVLLETNNDIVIPTSKFLPLNSQPQPLSLNYLPIINDTSLLLCPVHPCVTSTGSTPLSYAAPFLFYCLSLVIIWSPCLIHIQASFTCFYNIYYGSDCFFHPSSRPHTLKLYINLHSPSSPCTVIY